MQFNPIEKVFNPALCARMQRVALKESFELSVYNPLPVSYLQPVYKEVQFGISTDDVVGLSEPQRVSEELQFTFSIVDESTWLYKNYKYPRYRNFYGYAQLMSGAYVVRDIELIHINQELLHWQDSRAYIVQEVHCAARRLAQDIYLYSEKEPKENPLPVEMLVVLRQRYTSIRFRLCPGVKANVGIRWVETQGRCSGIFDPSDKQGDPKPSDNKNGNPGDRPSGQPEDPRDRSNNDGKDDPADDKPHEPVPGSKSVVSGQWYFTSRFSSTDRNCEFITGSAPIEGANDGSVQPYFVRTGTNTGCSNGSDGYIVHNGGNRQILSSDGTFSFNFVAG